MNERAGGFRNEVENGREGGAGAFFSGRSDLEGLKSQLGCGLKQLRVAGDECAGSRAAGGPGECRGELQGVGGLEWNAVEKALGLVAG
jgi:hypothetical protein